MTTPPTEALPEPQLNHLLRGVDWRFALANPNRPRALDWGSGVDPRALGLIADPPGDASPDLVLTGFPRPDTVARASQELGPGGEIVCLWRAPRPGGAARARRRLAAAGFSDVRVYWPGPLPHRAPQFWVPVESRAARDRLLSSRRPGSGAWAVLRLAWRLGAHLGMLAPACAVARLPDVVTPGEPDSAAGLRDRNSDWILLTGGKRSINKVVGLPVSSDDSRSALVTKFARVPASGDLLDHEATTLDRIRADHPDLTGVPRLLHRGERAGCRALAESAVPGRPLIESLDAASLDDLSRRVTAWLTGLVSPQGNRPASDWRRRLIEEPLRDLGRNFAPASPGVAARCQAVLAGLGDLPPASEHRDCSPWNVVIAADGALGLLDWESAEPDGLPGLDLVYFIANGAFILDGALETGNARPTYTRLLDPASAYGRILDHCLAEYGSQLAIPIVELQRLRLLCWIIHSRSDFRHLQMAAAGPPSPEALHRSLFLGLIEEELTWQEEADRA